MPRMFARILLAAATLLFAVPAPANPAPVPALSCTLKVGVERHYLLVVPPAYDGKLPVALVLVFHGAGNTSTDLQRNIGLSELAGQKGFIAAFPDGIDKRWNGGVSAPDSLDSARSDDVSFVAAMIDQLSARYRIDPKRVYATGSSNGAIFCYTLACRLSERIAAIAPVSGLLAERLIKDHPPAGPVSVIAFNGTDDPLLPFAGLRSPDRTLLSVYESIAFWAAVDRCDPKPVLTRYPPSPLDDGLTIFRIAYGTGDRNSSVEAVVIGHGGHTWPGHPTDPTWAKTAGKTAMSISANALMWDFFQAHPKP
jgi:polyhydroxybutyrate depolymerase